MQPEYFARLGESVQRLILEVEQQGRIVIQVEPDASLNELGPLGNGVLGVEINSRRTRIYAPTNGYFPDGAVRHEVLHVRRFHVDGVPKLVLADTVAFDPGLEAMFTEIDNAIEHLVIVPEEIHLHPDRRQHWELVVQEIWADAENIPPAERHFAACMNWTFMRHVLPTSPQTDIAKHFIDKHGLMASAERFADQVVELLPHKDRLIQYIVDTFPERPWCSGALQRFRAAEPVKPSACPEPVPRAHR